MTAQPDITTRTDVDELKARVDLRQMVEDHRGPGKRYGATLRWADGGSNQTVLAVWSDHFQNFKTGEKGDHFSFLMRERGLSFVEAVDYLARYAGGSVHPSVQSSSVPATSAASDPPTAAWQQEGRGVVETSQRFLWSPAGRKALDYLRQVRGLTDDTIRRFRLGYNPTQRRLNIRDDEGRPIFLKPGIVIPWFDGDVLWAIRTRSRVGNLAKHLGVTPDCWPSGNELPKYLSLKGSKPGEILFNIGDLAAGRDALLVEGEFDTMRAWQELGDELAVVTMGGAGGRLPRRARERLETAGKIYAALDNDAAGQKGNAYLAQALAERLVGLRVPNGKDITDFAQAGGDLRAWLHEGQRPCWWPGGVPDGVRTVIFKALPPSAAVTVDLLNSAMLAGLIDPQAITIPGMLVANETLGYGVPERTLRNMFADPDLSAGKATLVGVFLQKVETESLSQEGLTFGRNSDAGKRGRPADVFRALSLPAVEAALLEHLAPRLFEIEHPYGGDAPVLARPTAKMLQAVDVPADRLEAVAAELIARFTPAYNRQGSKECFAEKRARDEFERLAAGLRNPESTPIPEQWPKDSGARYRDGWLHALAESNPDERRSRRKIASTLGISQPYVGKVLKRAALENEQQPVETRPITPGADVHRQIGRLARSIGGRPFQLTSSALGEARPMPISDPDQVKAFVTQEMDKGAEVLIHFQVACKQRVVADLPPEPEPTEPPPDDVEVGAKPPAKSPEQTFYAPGYNPRWVTGQLLLGLLLLRGYYVDTREEQQVNRQTGQQYLVRYARVIDARPGDVRILFEGQLTIGELARLLGIAADTPPARLIELIRAATPNIAAGGNVGQYQLAQEALRFDPNVVIRRREPAQEV